MKWPDHLGDLRINGRLVLRWIFRKYGVHVWTEIFWLRIGSRGGLNVNIHTTPLIRYHGAMLRYRYSFAFVLNHKVGSAHLYVSQIFRKVIAAHLRIE
jgi:hypothetical protein